MESNDSDRSESATPHRLREARKKGSVARSSDLVALAMLATLALAVHAGALPALHRLQQLEVRILAAMGRSWTADGATHWLAEILLAAFAILAPLLLALVLIAVLINLVQTGPIFSWHPLQADLTRLNPVTGAKRLLSMRTLFESGKSLLKVVVLGSVVWHGVRGVAPGLVGLNGAQPKAQIVLTVGLVSGLLFKLVGALLVLALVDVGFVRWEFAKRMKMSKRDVKDEVKNREGDPRIRGRIRELRKDMLKRSQAVSRVAEADVLITNPTHLAIALSYQHGVSLAPTVLAKGAGQVALSMRTLARRHRVPIVENKALARALYRKTDFDSYVPEELYPHVAKIMVWVFAMRDASRNQ